MPHLPLPFCKSFLTYILSLALVACSSTPPKPVSPTGLKAGDYSYVKTYMSWFINSKMTETKTIGLSIALVDDQKIVWQQGFGLADKENNVKATPETRYRAGSISKVFNGMAVMKLVESGKMDIDKPLVTYLPEFRIKSRFGNTRGITPRTIMTHHSGLPGDWIDGMWAEKPKHFTKLAGLIKDEYVAYPVNKILAYSNLGITLLGHAVQNVSGQEYASYLQKVLLAPLRMQHSKFEQGLAGKGSAKSYNNGELVREYPLGDIPAGGLNTTVSDLSHLAMMVNRRGMMGKHRVISEKSLNSMFTVQNKNVPLDLGETIGLAWFINDHLLLNKEPVYTHNGATIAHRASFYVAPRSKLGVVVMANSSSAPVDSIATELLKKAWQAKRGIKLPTKTKLTPFKQAIMHTGIEGMYSTFVGSGTISKKAANRYRVNIDNESYDIRMAKDGRLLVKYRLFGFIPLKADELDEIRFSIHKIEGYQMIIADQDNRRQILGIKAEPHPISKAWHKRLGTYKAINPPEPDQFGIEKVVLKYNKGFLLAQQTYYEDGEKSTQNVLLTAVNDSEAILEGLGRNMRDTMHFITDKKGDELILYSGLRFKRVK